MIVDTETSGLYDPVHVVELSAQLMEGWEPVGNPFWMLLNHDVPIHPEATAIHGYTREFLQRSGYSPHRVHAAFRDYAGDCPLVAHNLNFDWNRALEPEWARLGIPPVGRRGFCCLMLARRLVTETAGHRLEVLKEHFQLTAGRSHQARHDVLTVVELFRKVYRRWLEPAGLDTFSAVADFSRLTPVSKCLDMVREERRAKAAAPPPLSPPAPAPDKWWYVDRGNVTQGPVSAREARERIGAEAFYVWRTGMSGWTVSNACPEFIDCLRLPAPPRRYQADKTMGELAGLCRGLTVNSRITTAQVMALHSWLQDAGPLLNQWPASEIAQTLERILEDGVVTKEEKEELRILIQRIMG